jgi:hypothetical protein
MKVTVKQDYRELRQADYLPTGNQLDAVFKLAKALKDTGMDLPEDVISWVDHCQSVKEKFPKA